MRMEQEHLRLHISPCSPDLLPFILPASVPPSTVNASFHSIPTFPENNYGYVTLPTEQAEKLRQKLNGSVLRGKRFRVEVARPIMMMTREEEEEEENDDRGQGHDFLDNKPTKKRKRRTEIPEASSNNVDENNLIEGYELPHGRQVKRGWTETPHSKMERRQRKQQNDDRIKLRPSSKYTEKAECLFHTSIPPNRMDDDKKKKKKKNKGSAVVHEFANTVTYPSFLRDAGDDGSKSSATFIDGKGWLDDSGNVIESVAVGGGGRGTEPREKKSSNVHVSSSGASSFSVSSSSSSSNGQKLSSDEGGKANITVTAENASSGSTSSSGDSSSDSTSSNDRESSAEGNINVAAENGSADSPSSDVHSSSSSTSSDDEESSSDGEEKKAPQETRQIHPLEALYKRPNAENKKDTSSAAPQFTFFGGNDDDGSDIEQDEDKLLSPLSLTLTPFTKTDLQIRAQRSAAPTPDTAMAPRRFFRSSSSSSDGEEEEKKEDQDSIAATKEGKEESDFVKWFWEFRGQNNRAFKKRRRDAAKESRQEENRRTGMKGKS